MDRGASELPNSRDYYYGRPAHAQTRRLATLLRDLSSAILAIDAPRDELDRAIGTVEALCQELTPLGATDLTARVGEEARPHQRVYLDRSQFLGDTVPFFPRYTLEMGEDGVARGRVFFDIGHEGPPGLVFGGSLALFMDMLFQHFGSLLGAAGFLVVQNMQFRAQTPILTEIDFEIRQESLVRRKRSLRVRLFLHGELLVECEGLIILRREEDRINNSPDLE